MYCFILQILILGIFKEVSTDIDTDFQYPKFDTNLLMFPVVFSIIDSWFCKFNNYVPFISLQTSILRLRRLDQNNVLFGANMSKKVWKKPV